MLHVVAQIPSVAKCFAKDGEFNHKGHEGAPRKFSVPPCLRGRFVLSMNPRRQSGVAKAPAILLLLAVAIFLAGALRYYRHGNFTLAQAGYCLVALVASLVVLLVFDYTLHHAKIAAVMVLVFAALFLVASPAFCVGMGLGLAGMVLAQGTG